MCAMIVMDSSHGDPACSFWFKTVQPPFPRPPQCGEWTDFLRAVASAAP